MNLDVSDRTVLKWEDLLSRHVQEHGNEAGVNATFGMMIAALGLMVAAQGRDETELAVRDLLPVLVDLAEARNLRGLTLGAFSDGGDALQ